MSISCTYVPAPPAKPWRTESELAMVRDWFYPNYMIPDPYAPPEGDTRQNAIDKVRVYIFNDHKTPHAVIATAYLAEALLHDEQVECKKCISNVAMMSIYAMAFVKFVNGFVDRDLAKTVRKDFVRTEGTTSTTEGSEDGEEIEQEQEKVKVMVKGGGESSMYALAAKIDMPESFVDLRHQIVHGQIPELWMLEKKTEQALEWLWEKWWKVHATGDPAKALRAREEKKRVLEKARELRMQKRRRVNEDESDENRSIDRDLQNNDV